MMTLLRWSLQKLNTPSVIPSEKNEDDDDTTIESRKKPKAGANGDKPSWIRHLKPLSGTKYKVGDTK